MEITDKPAATSTALGATVEDGAVTFTVWAPRQPSVWLRLGDRDDVPMARGEDGYFSLRVAGVRAGEEYQFRIAEGLRADPASRFQPGGPTGPSVVVDPGAFRWTDHRWPGAPPRHRQVIYELHIGTFTPQGTWHGARERLRSLAELGVTTLEVMPIAEFPGRFGWGYDGVFLFAPFHEYGTPDDVRSFVDEAHRIGLAVILDVVYNHIGPAGNVLPDYSDSYLSVHETEWGRGFNFDGEHAPAVRRFMRANVEHWVREYHFDGFRFDATQSMVDRSPEHIVNELTRCARTAAGARRLYIVAENESQQVAFLRRNEQDVGGLDSLWNEDWHHTAIVALTGRQEAYCSDYDGTASEFAAMARWNLLYQGQWYAWQKRQRGSDARSCSSAAFVCFLENHDQVANTGLGARLHQIAIPGQWRATVSLLLLGPSLPMLFQGQECATPARFTYFADHEEPLATAVRQGRLEFLSQFPALADPQARASLPDPGDEGAFRACRIDWRDGPEAERARRLHLDLLTLRRVDRVLSALGTSEVQVTASAPAANVVLVRYAMKEDEALIVVNLGDRVRLRMSDPLLAPPSGRAWALAWCSEQVHYGGPGVSAFETDAPWDLQATCAWMLTGLPADPAHKSATAEV